MAPNGIRSSFHNNKGFHEDDDDNNKKNETNDEREHGSKVSSEEGKKQKSYMKKCSDAVNRTLEKIWYNIGFFIGSHPIWVIAGSALFACLFIIGILRFNEETDDVKLWVPESSDLVWQADWIKKTFPSNIRIQQVLLEAEEGRNVLNSKHLKMIADMVDQIYNISRRMEGTEAEKDFRFQGCVAISDLWQSRRSTIENLTETEISNAIQSNLALKNMIGGIKYEGGRIISAQATTITCTLLTLKISSVKGYETWEKLFVTQFNGTDLPEKKDLAKVHAFNTWINERDFDETVDSDLAVLFIGFVFIIAYVAVMLGEFNRHAHRIWIAFVAVLAVGFGIGSSYGMASAFGLFYGPVHSILPFLLLGIGIDDAFIIVQGFDNLEPTLRASAKPPVLMAETMRHAGAAITVTSITDFIVFAISATSILPTMRSFCFFAALGILWIYLLQTTFFASFLCLDITRASKNRDACLPCLALPENYKPNSFSKKRFLQRFFEEVLAKVILHKFVKPVLILITLGLFAGGLYGVLSIEQDFDPMVYLATDTPTSQYSKSLKKFFPSSGEFGFVYIVHDDLFKDQESLQRLVDQLEGSGEVKNGTVESWFSAFHEWNGRRSFERSGLCQNVTVFLQSSAGVRYSGDVILADDNCTVTASRVKFQHIDYDGASSEIRGMNELKRLVPLVMNKPLEKAFPYAIIYNPWTANEIIGEELIRNCLIALACVFVATLVFIASPLTCVYVVVCVLFTLVDVGGVLFYWDVTIEAVTGTCMTLAIGLCVDYAAHIGSVFMTVQGTRDARARKTLSIMGPGVFNGGFSTYLAFVLLSGSNSFIFTTFFKVLFSVVVFGLFHGLILLPIILSYIGPAPHDSAGSRVAPVGVSGSNTSKEIPGHDNNNNASKKVKSDAVYDETATTRAQFAPAKHSAKYELHPQRLI